MRPRRARQGASLQLQRVLRAGRVRQRLSRQTSLRRVARPESLPKMGPAPAQGPMGRRPARRLERFAGGAVQRAGAVLLPRALH